MIDENYENNILEKMTIPYVVFPQKTILQKKMLAWHVASLRNEEPLFASSLAFSYEGFVAGINTGQIEYFMKNAPRSYKIELMNAILSEDFVESIFEIAKMMDEDLGTGKTENQNRIKNVIRYIKDNREAFEF